MVDRNNLVALMKQVAKADPSAPVAHSYNDKSLSYDALNEPLREELNEYAGTYAQYRENKHLIFSIIEETLDEVLRQQPDMKTILNSSSLHHSMTPAEVKEKGYTAASYNINVILQHPEWIQEFKDLGIETFFWMVNSAYLYDLAGELGFTWATTDFRDAIK